MTLTFPNDIIVTNTATIFYLVTIFREKRAPWWKREKQVCWFQITDSLNDGKLLGYQKVPKLYFKMDTFGVNLIYYLDPCKSYIANYTRFLFFSSLSASPPRLRSYQVQGTIIEEVAAQIPTFVCCVSNPKVQFWLGSGLFQALATGNRLWSTTIELQEVK